MELYSKACFKNTFLREVFLILPALTFLLLIRLPEFFHQVTFAIAMHRWPRFILAKRGGNICSVRIKTGVNQQP